MDSKQFHPLTKNNEKEKPREKSKEREKDEEIFVNHFSSFEIMAASVRVVDISEISSFLRGYSGNPV